MPHYVEVPAHEIESFLQARGFERTVQRNEVVYVRPHRRDADVKIKVYTSIRVGSATARRKGTDSIKVCTVFDNGRKSFGLGRFPRVHRTGSTEAVKERVLERMRQAYQRGTEWIREQAIRRGTNARSEDLAWKAAYGKQERRSEEAGFRSDPDFKEGYAGGI